MVVRWLDGLSFEEVFEFHFFGGMEASRVERIFFSTRTDEDGVDVVWA